MGSRAYITSRTLFKKKKNYNYTVIFRPVKMRDPEASVLLVSL